MKVPQRKNNRYMKGDDLIKKAYNFRSGTDIETTGKLLQKLVNKT